MPSVLRRTAISLLLAVLFLLQAAAFSYPDLESRYEYAYDAIDRVYRLGIMQGTVGEEGRVFRPDSYLERQEFFRIVYSLNHAGRTEVGAFYEKQLSQIDLVDLDDISPWARGYAGYNLVNRFFIGNHYRELLPRAPLTYLECIIVMMRVLGYSSDALARMEQEDLSAWQERLFHYANQNDLFAGIPEEPLASVLAAKPIIRAHAAVLLSNVLSAKLVTFIPVPDGGGVYLPSSLSVLEHSFGDVWEQSSVAVSLALPYENAPLEMAEGYILEDGSILPLVVPSSADLSLLGRTLTYTAATNNDFISWNGQGGPSDEIILVEAEQLQLASEENGALTISAGERVFTYSAEEAEQALVYFFEDNDTAGQAMSLSILSTALYPYTLYAGRTPVRLVLDAEGNLQSVNILPITNLFFRR